MNIGRKQVDDSMSFLNDGFGFKPHGNKVTTRPVMCRRYSFNPAISREKMSVIKGEIKLYLVFGFFLKKQQQPASLLLMETNVACFAEMFWRYSSQFNVME